MLKVLKQDYPIPSELTRYKQEYQITRSLDDIEGAIAAYDLLPYENTLVIVLEDFGGQSLSRLMQSQKFELSEFIQIAIQTATVLGEIHGKNIIHKDINPANILLNLETGQVKIIDFGISTLFARENPVIKNPDVLEGTLAYMSPEQTGRMNRTLDYRTDFYSLGATFYQILTQQLLFETEDALSLVHCHLAREPIAPDEIDSSIPKTLSQIVMKLLAKTAEERYQSALGLKADLEECRLQLEQTGTIAEFPLARQDIIEKLQIPQKLYGREAEIEQLLATFGRVTQAELQGEEKEQTNSYKQVEMMLVGGYSGVGKTALIQELYKPLSQQRGYFIAGKFDQFQRSLPYSAVISAFQSLVKQLLAERDAQLSQWREKLKTALGINGQVLVDVIPEIEEVIGPQPPVQSLEPTEAQNRFNQVFQNFIRVFCQPSHPLVIFLDDLQWADFGTLKLIELIMTDNQIESLLLLGAYRDNEVDINHPTIVAIERLKEQGAIVNQILLTPLKSDDITQLLAETLHCDRATVSSLKELILQKTSGNPFFVNEFMKTIYQENLLAFNRQRRCWEWDMPQIQNLNITDNVVDLMLGKLRTLPEETQTILCLSACIGNHFDLDTLSIIAEKSSPETFRELVPAIQQGLVQPTSELETTPEAPIDSALVIQDYKFRHDRIQQAAYNLIDRARSKLLHLQIARLLFANLTPNEQQEKIFTLVDHFNKGLELIEDKEEKIKILELNLNAGKRAKEAIAYAAARNYLLIARNEFPGDIWEESYELAIQVYRDLAEIEYLNGNFPESQVLIEQSIKRVKSPIDGAVFYELQIVQCTLQGEVQKAVELGRVALRTLGINLPEDNFQAAFEEELSEFNRNLGNREIADLYNNQEMTLLDKQAISKIFPHLFAAVWILDPALMYVVGSKMANLNIKYGHTPTSPMAYIYFGSINTHALKEYSTGYELGCLATKLANKYNNLSSKATVCELHGSMTMPWLVHIKFSEKIMDEGVNVGIQAGDLQVVGYLRTYRLYNLIYQGKSLGMLDIDRSLYFCQETKNQWTINCILAAKMAISNLVSENSDRLNFDLENFSESDFLETCEGDKIMAAICFYQILKAQVLYLYEIYAPLSLLEQSSKLLDYIPATISIAKHNFYYSLTLIAHYPEASSEEQQKYWQQVETNQKQMRVWADNCEANFLHKYLLVAAEIARISDKWPEATELYDRAIESAKEHEFVQNEALGNELAAKFWLSRGKEDFAKLYMRKARQGYQIWGAKRKVKDLEEKYPQWFVSQSSASQGESVTTTGRTTQSLDIATVIQSSQTLAGEIVLKNLLGKLMEIAIANAGAEKGFLLLKRGDRWFIEAEGRVDNSDVRTLQSIPIETEAPDKALLPLGIVNYVDRTQNNVILNDAVNEGEYTRDPYIIANKTKSILCTPLVNQGRVSGILYLENNLATNTFTRDRVELLQTLSTQAAISIENAQLYTQLEDYSHSLEVKVEERTAELAAATEEAQSANKAKSTFIANMSHELRSPLNAILGFSQLMLRSRGLSKEYAENLGIITRSGEHLLTLINNVLDLSKIESGKTTLNEKNFDLYRLLDDMEDMFGLKAKEKGLQLTCDRSPEVPRYIRTDQVKLRQVIINLLNNALKFTPEGGVSVGATVGEDRGNERVAIHFEIADTGAGIAPEEIDSLFEAFVQTSTGKQAQEGTGLGLPISRQFVQLMGGDMGVRSQVGKGTAFYFEIVVPRVEGADVESNKPTRQIIALEPNQPRYRILIVDDKPINRKLLIELLNPLGFELKEANNGQEAVDIFSEWEPHLIWMDMRMPVMDGYEATRAIKGTPKGETTKIIALTANVLEEEKAVVIEAGCDDFLRKPFRETEIFEMMSTHIGVSYVYEEERKTDEAEGIPSGEVLTAEAIKALPGELIASLEEALLEGDLDSMTTITEEISTQNAPLAAALKTCLDKVLSLM